MNKYSSLVKKLNKYTLSIKDLIENFFENLKIFFLNLKKGNLSKNNRVFLLIVSVAILTLSYFLIPTLYNKDIIQSKIKNQILQKYKIDIKFNEEIRYEFFPKPHFVAKNVIILNQKKEIAKVKNLKFYIASNKLFLINEITLKDLIIQKADFNIYKYNFNFFIDLLNIEPNENKIEIKNSNIFFKNDDEEVLFINKIYNSKFFFDSNKLENTLISKNQIFNVPYKFSIRNNKFNKKVYSSFYSKKIRLNLENEINYNDDDNKKGILDIGLINKSTSMEYEIKKDSLNFFSEDRTNSYEGLIDFKPFYFSAEFNYNGLSSKNILNEESFLFDLIKSEILNNSNLNFSAIFKVKDITNIDELNNLILKLNVQQGDIIATNSSVMWKDDLKIILKESLLSSDQNEINLSGSILIELKDVSDFYTSFQVKKKSRKDINQIVFDFNYNLSQKKLNFDNVKVNNSSNLELDEFINNFNDKKNFTLNKITFKNFVNNFFEAYSG